MGRVFATCYRVVLVGVSLAALVLSIMSATSCAFIKYDHQYKDDGRFLFSFSSTRDADRRGLPQSTAMSTSDTYDAPMDDTATVDAATDDATTDDTTHFNGTKTTTTKHSNGTATVAHLHPNGTKVTTHPNGTTVTSHPATTGTQVTHANGATTTVVQHPNGTTVAVLTHPNGTTVTKHPDGTTTTTHGNANSDAPATDVDDNDDIVTNAVLGSSSAVTAGAAAATSGGAGLFCEGAKSISITSLWGGTFQDLENKIADESDRNQSEELARNAAIVSTMFGAVVVFVLLVGSSIGWRCFCESWIVGLVAMMACASQGITFLFFNSERYCDGDIINEIINQEPCVIGEGGKYSVAALVLYAVAMILVCRLPQDDPYVWCSRCKKGGRDPVKSSDPIGDGASPGGGKSVFFGSKEGSSDVENGNTARSERPNWLSSEAAREKDEEHEII